MSKFGRSYAFFTIKETTLYYCVRNKFLLFFSVPKGEMSSDEDSDGSSSQSFDELPGADSTKGTEMVRLGSETAVTESVALDDTTTDADSSESGVDETVEIHELDATSDHSEESFSSTQISLREEPPTAPRTPQQNTAGRPPRPPRPTSPAGLDLPVYRFGDSEQSPPSKTVKTSKALPPPLSPKSSPARQHSIVSQASPARSARSQKQQIINETTDDDRRPTTSDSGGKQRSNSITKKLRRRDSVQSNQSRRSTGRRGSQSQKNINIERDYQRYDDDNVEEEGEGFIIRNNNNNHSNPIHQSQRYDKRVENVSRQLSEIDDRLATRLPKHSHCRLHHSQPQQNPIVRYSSPAPAARSSAPTEESIQRITEAILAKTGYGQQQQIIHRFESPQAGGGRKMKNKFMKQTQSAVAKRKAFTTNFTSGQIEEPKSTVIHRGVSSLSLNRSMSQGPNDGANLTRDEIDSLRQLAAAVKGRLSPSKQAKELLQQQQLTSVINTAMGPYSQSDVPMLDFTAVKKPLPEDTKIAGSRRTHIRSYSSMSDRKKHLQSSKKNTRSRTPPVSVQQPTQQAVGSPFIASPNVVAPPSGGWVWVPPQGLGMVNYQQQGDVVQSGAVDQKRQSKKSHSRPRRSEKISTSHDSSSYCGITSTTKTTYRSSSVSTIDLQVSKKSKATSPITPRTSRGTKSIPHNHLHAEHVQRASRRDRMVENDEKRWKLHSNIINHIQADDVDARKDRLRVIKIKIREAFDQIDSYGTGFVTIQKAERWLHESESNLGSRRGGHQANEQLVDFVGVSFLPALRMADVKTFTFEGAFKAFDSFKKGAGYHPFLTGKKPTSFPNESVLDKPVISMKTKQLAQNYRTRQNESFIKQQMCAELSDCVFSPSISAVHTRDESVATSLPSPPTPNSPTLSLGANVRIEDPKRKLKIDILLSRISNLAKVVKQG